MYVFRHGISPKRIDETERGVHFGVSFVLDLEQLPRRSGRSMARMRNMNVKADRDGCSGIKPPGSGTSGAAVIERRLCDTVSSC
jgi:hypothetical protein